METLDDSLPGITDILKKHTFKGTNGLIQNNGFYNTFFYQLFSCFIIINILVVLCRESSPIRGIYSVKLNLMIISFWHEPESVLNHQHPTIWIPNRTGSKRKLANQQAWKGDTEDVFSTRMINKRVKIVWNASESYEGTVISYLASKKKFKVFNLSINLFPDSQIKYDDGDLTWEAYSENTWSIII